MNQFGMLRGTNKTVLYKGDKIKVFFDSVYCGSGVREGSYIINNMTYIINGKSYPVVRRTKQITCQNGSVGYSRTLTFEGATIPDNDKKLIELILIKKGI